MANPTFSQPCPECEAQLPSDCRFCPQCGHAVASDETAEITPEPVVAAAGIPSEPAPPVLHRVERRPFGLHPLPLLGGLGALALMVAIALAATGPLVAAVILLVLAIVCFALFAGGVRREPEAPAARAVQRSGDRARSLSRLAWISIQARTRSGLQLLRIRGRQQRLRRELKASLAPLGEAVHDNDAPRARQLKRHAAQLEREISESEREAAAVQAASRQEIEHERRTVQPTQAFTPIRER